MTTDAAANGQRGLATYQPQIMPESRVNATDHSTTKENKAYGGRPLAETEEAHGLIKGLGELLSELGGRWLALVRRGRASDRK